MFKVKKFEARTLRWWSKQTDKIEFNPPYQRKGSVWLPYAKAYLIDSIINGFDIPKIYLADFTYANTQLNTTNKPYAIIDGRQRLEAIFGFLRDDFPLNNDFVFHDDPSLKLAGLFYSQIEQYHNQIASDVIDQFNLDVVSIITDDESKIRELFIRLNQGAALKGAEVRNAMQGVLPEMTRRLCETNLFRASSFNKNRGQDKNTAAKIILIAAHGQFTNTKKKDLDAFFLKWNGARSTPFDHEIEKAIEILDNAGAYFNHNAPSLRTEALIPLYYMLFKEYGVHNATVSFINSFDAKRRNARLKRSTHNESQIEILQFSSYIRNSNDASGLAGAYEIMKSCYVNNNIY